jgi:hypothetical protein
MKWLLFVLPFLATMLTYAPAATPTPGNWNPAVLSTVSALGDSKGFTIIANVQLPQPKACYDVRISKELITIPPYRYVVSQRHNGKICKDVVTPYLAKQHFDVKPWPRSVDVYALDLQNKPKHWVLPVIIEHS